MVASGGNAPPKVVDQQIYSLSRYLIRQLALNMEHRADLETASTAWKAVTLAFVLSVLNFWSEWRVSQSRHLVPKTSALLLSYTPLSHLKESNLQPSHYKWDALPIVLRWLFKMAELRWVAHRFTGLEDPVLSSWIIARIEIGTTYGTRNRDPHIKSVLLYQLS